MLCLTAMRMAMVFFLATPLAISATTRGELTKDDHFLAAAQAFGKANSKKLAEHAQALQGYVLEPYVEYWQLSLDIDRLPAEAVRGFFARYPDTLAAELLRRDWLKALARRGEWATFESEFAKVAGEDPELACLALQAHLGRGDAAVADEFQRMWLNPRVLPDGCAPLIGALIAAGKLAPRDIWQRARLLAESGDFSAAKRALSFLPAGERPSERTVDGIRSRPTRFLEQAQRLNLEQRANRELLLLAFARAARDNAELAATYWTPKLQARLPDSDQAWVWSQIATSAARQHNRRALDWFAQVEPSALSQESLEWRARAALREGNWAEVRAAIEKMTPLAQNEPAWVYWRGRALRASGKRDQADVLFRRVAGDPHFYGKLALEELGQTLVVPQRYTPTEADVEEVAANAGVHRALALLRLDLRTEGLREWSWALRDMDDRQLLAAAEFARRREFWDRAMNAADRTVGLHDFSARFLAPYRDVFAERSKSQGLEEYWVLGLARQESRFNTNARSPAGAVGLMQLMPRTAKWVANRIGMKGFSLASIHDVDVNIALGTSYLRYILDELDGSVVLAAAAYNAGPGRARKWKADQPLEGAAYIETIPLLETRDYVKRVMSNTMYYAALYGGEPAKLKSRLGVVPPRRAGEGYEPTITGQATVE